MSDWFGAVSGHLAHLAKFLMFASTAVVKQIIKVHGLLVGCTIWNRTVCHNSVVIWSNNSNADPSGPTSPISKCCATRMNFTERVLIT